MDQLTGLRAIIVHLVNHPEPGVLCRGPEGKVYRLTLTEVPREEFEALCADPGVTDMTSLLSGEVRPWQN